MKGKWVNFFRELDDQSMSILMDSQYSELDAKYPICASLTLFMHDPRPDGLSSQDEYSALMDVEQALDEVVVDWAKYVGRMTGKGKRVFYFYLPSSEVQLLDAVMRRFPEYRSEVRTRLDTDWSFYFDFLLPSPEENQRIKNANVLGVLENHGDSLTTERDVRHWIYFESEADRYRFLEVCLADGFKKEFDCESPDYDAKCKYCLCISRVDKVDSDSIDKSVLDLYRLAEQFGAIYDGWETEVIANPN